MFNLRPNRKYLATAPVKERTNERESNQHDCDD